MTAIQRFLFVLVTGALVSLGLSGCYTRIALKESPPEYAYEDEEYAVEEEAVDSTYDDRGQYWDDEIRWRAGTQFRYYSPWYRSYYYRLYDPWYYDYFYNPWVYNDPWYGYYGPYSRYSPYGYYYSGYAGYYGFYGLGYYPYSQPVIYYGAGGETYAPTRNSGYSRTGDVRSNPRSPGSSSGSVGTLPPATRAGVSRDGGPARSSGSSGVERRSSSGSSRESSVGRSSRGTSSGRESVSPGRSSGSSGRSSGSGSRGGGGGTEGSGSNRSSGGSRGGGGESAPSSSAQQSYTPPPSAPVAAPPAASSSGHNRSTGATRDQ